MEGIRNCIIRGIESSRAQKKNSNLNVDTTLIPLFSCIFFIFFSLSLEFGFALNLFSVQLAMERSPFGEIHKLGEFYDFLVISIFG